MIPENHKWCAECGHTKPLDEFFADRRSGDGKTSYCKPCMTRRNAESKARRARGERIERRRPTRRRVVHVTEKRCPACGDTKPPDAFVVNRAAARGRGAYCLPWRRYGVTDADVAATVAAPGGGCAICAVRPAEHVDHDHDSGAVRGILCFTCNVGLGNFGDDPHRLLLAHRYLTRSRATVDTAARLRTILRRAS